MEVGARFEGDRMVVMENVAIKARYWGRIKQEKEYKVLKSYVITLVKSVDLARDGTGAEAVVIQGGPGTDKVKIRFKSRWFRGVYHTVEIYGKLGWISS